MDLGQVTRRRKELRAEGRASPWPRILAADTLLLVILIPTPIPGLGAEPSPVPEQRAASPPSPKPTETQEASQAARGASPQLTLLVRVLDENSVGVLSARVTLAGTQRVLQGETDYAGRYEFADFNPGVYQVRAEKEGFYTVVQSDVRLLGTEVLEVTLNHVREFTESVNVVYSPPAIDATKTSGSAKLGSEDIINLPYTVKRDIRYALPLLPGVVQDVFGQVHVAGSSARAIFYQLDGFNIVDPATGLFNMRVSVDALRSVEVQSSRASAEYGKGSGGVLSLRTGMGDDRFRYSATDFVPSLQSRKGIHLNAWTPRGTLSGPLRKGKAWFLLAADGEYDLTIVQDLPPGADRSPAWRMSNLSNAQVNLSPRNILTTSFLVNRFRLEHAGLSRFDPAETTVNLSQAAYLFSLKDQAFLGNGVLLEAGLGITHFHGDSSPLGDKTYTISPEGTAGNFFLTAEGRAGRIQGIANLVFSPRQWHGRHELKLGTDINRVTNHQSFERRPILILRSDGTLTREVVFAGTGSFTRNNFEVSGFAQDRWSVSNRLLVEYGVRFDWDEVVRRALFSPRLASSWMLTAAGDTKLSLGAGVYYDASNLDLITRPLTGRRFDSFFDGSGQVLIRPPVETSFQVNDRNLKQTRFLNWSVGLERKLPSALYLRAQFVRKQGTDGWTFLNRGGDQTGGFSGRFELANERRDRYDSLELTLKRAFKGNRVVFASYTRSAARSNAVLNFNIDSPLFSQQAGGPLPWDTPHRFISWGWLPLPRKFDLAYTLDWRDGYPFTVINEDQQLVGLPGSRRFPGFFSLSVHIERRSSLLGFQWALRAGLDNLTNHHNPSVVNSNVDSPHFLTYGGSLGRALVGRIRLLGRK